MKKQNKPKARKIYNPDFLTPEERQERIVELLTRGVLRLIEKKKKLARPEASTH